MKPKTKPGWTNNAVDVLTNAVGLCYRVVEPVDNVHSWSLSCCKLQFLMIFLDLRCMGELVSTNIYTKT